jgi:hypothetical protein
MLRLKALGGVLLGCFIMVLIGLLFYKFGSISQATGVSGTAMALFLANLFSKNKAPFFSAIMVLPFCLATAYAISVYLPAKEIVDDFSYNIEYNEQYRTEFLAEYNADPQFGLEYENDPDDYYSMFYDDWLILTEDFNGNLEEFNHYYDEEWIKPNADRQELAYWFTHPDQLIDDNDYYVGGTGATEDFRNLLIYNMLGAGAVSVLTLIVYIIKRKEVLKVINN